MKTVFLHIGLHKTGSTAIQVFFSSNREAFASKHRVLYPKAGTPTQSSISYGHHLLAWELTRPDSVHGAWDALLTELQHSDARQIVLSTEEFDTLSEPQIRTIGDSLKGHTVKVVAYLRRQDEFAQAYYATDVIFNRETRDFDEYVANSRTPLDYSILLDRWASVFAKEAIHCRLYDRSALTGGDVIRDFCNIVNHRLEQGLSSEKSINRGYPRNIVEAARSLRKAGLPDATILKVAQIAKVVYPNHDYYDIIPPSKARQVMKDYEASNARVAREYLGNSSGVLFSSLDYILTDAEWDRRYRRHYGNIEKTIEDLYDLIVARKS